MESKPQSILEEGKHNNQWTANVYLWLTFTFLFVNMFVLIKVAPTFTDVFTSFGARLPWNITFVLNLGDKLRWLDNPVGLIVLLVALLMLTIFIKRSNLMEPKRAEWVYFFCIVFRVYRSSDVYANVGAGKRTRLMEKLFRRIKCRTFT